MLKTSLKTDMVEASFRKMRLTFYECLNVEMMSLLENVGSCTILERSFGG